LPIIGQGDNQGHIKQETIVTKRRRIEITILRRRTTITRRDTLEDCVAELPLRDDLMALPVRAEELSPLIEAKLNNTQATQHKADGPSIVEPDGQEPELIP
jgi:hypothetical protein